MTLVVNPSSTGGSNDTSPAQCTTASMSLGSVGTSARSPSTTATRAASTASTPPAASTTSAKIGFSRSLAMRSAPLIDPLGRTSTDIRTSGTSLSIRCSSASPTKPVTPVMQDVLARQPVRDRSLRPHGCDRAMCRARATRGVLVLRLRRRAAQPRPCWTFFLMNRRGRTKTPSSDTIQTMTVAAIHVPAPSIERPLETSEVTIRPTRVATRATPPRKQAPRSWPSG